MLGNSTCLHYIFYHRRELWATDFSVSYALIIVPIRERKRGLSVDIEDVAFIRWVIDPKGAPGGVEEARAGFFRAKEDPPAVKRGDPLELS